MESVDLRAMRALTHPLRLDLLELLTAHGPATAAGCGRALGVAQANCSFHLRQLAKYGFVEEADQGADRRERRWRVAPARSVIRFGPEYEGVALRQLDRLLVERESRAILEHLDRRDAEGSAADVAYSKLIAGVLAVTEEEAETLKRRWRELIEPYLVTAERAGEEHRKIRVFLSMTPMAPPADDGSGDGDEHEH